MPNDIASQAFFYVDWSGGSLRTTKVKSWDVDDDASSEIVTAVGVKGGAGVRHKEGGGKIVAEVFRESGKPEVPYQALKVAREQIRITTQDAGGGARQQFTAYVSDIKEKHDDQGSHMDTVTFVFTQRRSLPSSTTA